LEQKKKKITGRHGDAFGCDKTGFGAGDIKVTTPTTPQAKLWNGYKSHSLKPAYEPIIMAIKPNEGSYAQNALKWGVGGLNIDGGRIGNEIIKSRGGRKSVVSGDTRTGKALGMSAPHKSLNTEHTGRFPANILLDEESAKLLDQQSGMRSAGSFPSRRGSSAFFELGNAENRNEFVGRLSDKGGASRFFYVAKASKSERNIGLEGFEKKRAGGMSGRNDGSFDGRITYNQNYHPTVKPLKLMEYLVKLTSMPNKDQIYLDPFCGSGTTCMAVKRLGKSYIGIEKEFDYVRIAQKRISAISAPLI